MTSQKTGVLRLEAMGPGGRLEPMKLDPASFASPLPDQNVHLYYSDEKTGINVGVWDTTTMQEAFGPYPGDEFIYVIEGRFELLDGKGGAVPAKAGECVAFRNGAPVSWKQDGYLKKFFMTYLDPAAETPEIESADGAIIVMDPDIPLAPGDADGAQRERTVFTNDTGNMEIGVWESDAMDTGFFTFPRHEFIHMLKGEAIVTTEDGTAQTFGAGDTFFIAHGTHCRWQVPRFARKYFATLDMS